MNADADRVLKALRAKHAGDVFVSECKNGPTQQGSHRRLDAWVLLKTWSPVTSIGYEIKVSRSDWRRDEKLSEYAGLVHLFYIVAPKGIIPREELPSGIGLIEMTGDTDRLVTRQRAERREIEMPVSLMVYVLMCRAKIEKEHGWTESMFDRRQWAVKELRQWVQDKDERRSLSYAVSQKIRLSFDAQEIELRRLNERVKALENIEALVRELGFDPTELSSAWPVTDRIRRLVGIVDNGVLQSIDRTMRDLEITRDALKAMREQAERVA